MGRAAFDNVGRLVMDDELNSMLAEVGGPCNYDNMIKMFEAKMAGGVNDPDELVVNAFKAFDMEVEEKVKGQMVTRHVIDREEFTHILMNFGEKMTQDEIDDIYGKFDFDDNKDIFTKSVVDLFVAGAMDEKEEEEEKKEEEAAAAEGGEEGATKKKKKKKKAAKKISSFLYFYVATLAAVEKATCKVVFILVEFHYLLIYCCQTINKTDVML